MDKTERLIRTKLRLPFTRQALVPRPRLQEQIANGLRGPLTLITAPAGFGKTTLVASCVASLSMAVAWLSLDKDDDQVERFLSYLIAAIQEADQTIGAEAAQLMAAVRHPSPDAILTSLINDLDRAGREIALVLDDYQFLHSQAVHEAVAFLLDHCPRTFHLVIATRSDPPLPLTRLRARGQMVELRAADLGFTEGEAAQFLNDVMGLHLDAGSVTALVARTEGWISGLQMAALSMRDRGDVRGFIEGFSGTHRYILDYLLEEVLAGQSPEVQRFLLRTSILDRISAPLCDALLSIDGGTERAGAAQSLAPRSASASPSAAILAYLDRANLFLVPLDDERIWYRYHHLFADLLRTQLQGAVGVQGVAQLHACAADWHGQNGFLLEAIHHASMAADEERVERSIEQTYLELVRRGEQSWLRSWISSLSRERIRSRPWLCIYEAYSHSWFGELDDADVLLEEAEARMGSETAGSGARALDGLWAYVKSRVTAMRGDLDRAIELCLVARDHVPAGNLALQLDTYITLGYVTYLKGDSLNADSTLNETIRLGSATGAVTNTVAAACVLARLYAAQGLLTKSHDTYLTAMSLIPEVGGKHRGVRALVEIGLADTLCERNDLPAALNHLQRGLDLLPWWDKADDWILAYGTKARICLAQGNLPDALEAVEKAAHLSRTRGIFSEARTALEVAQVRLWLAQGDLQAAGRWVASQEAGLCSDGLWGFGSEPLGMMQARVSIAQANFVEAICWLSQLEATTRSASRRGRLIEVLLLKALALRRTGDVEGAFLALTEGLTLAEPEGYVRVFLDEGPSMRDLLAQWLARVGAGPLRDYAIRLLSLFDAEAADATAVPAEGPPTGGLVEPLSPRELDVLRIMAQGRTNREIAAALFVAPGTVKAHTSSIYRKLDVANRTEAVARARQLGLLP